MSTSVHQFTLYTITGSPLPLSQFAGKKILLVNTASACGFTPQYQQLQQLYDNYQQKVEIIALPCNDFGAQEPGTEHEIEQFCQKNYGVTFPISQKVTILGSHPHPLYMFLMKKELNGYRDSEVKWNFQKYLANENGQLFKIFGSAVEPLSEEILRLIE